VNVVFLGAKGSAVTTTALAVASRWPVTSAPAMLIEADASGGDIAARFDLPNSPSLLTAAATLQQPTPGLLLEHAHALPGVVRVVAAPMRAAEVSGGLADFTRAVLAPMRHRTDVHLLVDAGRCDPRSLPVLATYADLVVLVVRQDGRSAPATLGRCVHAQQLVDAIASRGLPLAAVLVGDAPYRASEIATFLGTALLGVLPEDPYGASHLSGRSATGRAARRTRLARDAATLATLLTARLERPLDSIEAAEMAKVSS
jgi:hypothetical protein